MIFVSMVNVMSVKHCEKENDGQLNFDVDDKNENGEKENDGQLNFDVDENENGEKENDADSVDF